MLDLPADQIENVLQELVGLVNEGELLATCHFCENYLDFTELEQRYCNC